ncbi:MAG: hypothetical protein ABW156_08690 [Jiangellaceae bacterium]
MKIAVAHHVSAMVIRAQAGRVVAGADPAAAVEALEGVRPRRALLDKGIRTGGVRRLDPYQPTDVHGELYVLSDYPGWLIKVRFERVPAKRLVRRWSITRLRMNC